MIRRNGTWTAAAALLAATAVQTRTDAGPELPLGFIAQPIGGAFATPTGLAFLGPDKLVVSEKRGTLWYVADGAKKNLVLDLQAEALDNGDRGLLSVAADPDFASNGFLYLALVVDPNQDGSEDEQFAFGRLVRYATSFAPNGDLVADPLSRKVLIGQDWTSGTPSCHLSHALGKIRFFQDGSLVLTTGDGAHYDYADAGGHDAPCFGPGKLTPDQDLGSFRSLYLDTLAGKVLRVDRATGLGLPDNPWWNGNPAAPRSRVWAAGLRNPFRSTLVPGSGPQESLIIADVGWNTWEELNACQGGESFGWPCHEGPGPQGGYQAIDPAGFCPMLAPEAPLLAWHHTNAGALGFKGNCATGVAFYTGTSYPPLYQGALFSCEFGAGWIRVLRLDSSLGIVANQPFATKAANPIDLEVDPATGDLILLSLENGGAVSRIRWVGEALPPVAVASASATFGALPLAVQFTGSQSSDPKNSALTYAWDFGDGTSSTAADPQKTYAAAGAFAVQLTVTNALGYAATAELLVTAGNFPPEIVAVRSPVDGSSYTAGSVVPLLAFARDLEDVAAGIPLDASWHVDLVHQDHVHPDYAVVHGFGGSFVAQPHGDAAFYRARFVAKDSLGLASTAEAEIYDAAKLPVPKLVSLSDSTPRLGTPISITAKVFWPGVYDPTRLPTLVIDFGDGASQTFTQVADQELKTAEHLYAAVGSYTLKLTANVGSKTASTTVPIDVQFGTPAIAIFTPLLAPGFLDWDEQQAVAAAIDSMVSPLAGGTEVRAFAFDEQDELVAWMAPYLGDSVRDALVVLDLAPKAVFGGQIDGSLLEEWLEHGNGVVWTGAQPFFTYVDEQAKTSTVLAGPYGGDFIFDAPFLTLLTQGTGAQSLTPLAAAELPSLAPYVAHRAFKWQQVPPAWTLDRLYADNAAHQSDALALRHQAGGFYAEFFCADGDFPRAAVIAEFLKAYLTGP